MDKEIYSINIQDFLIINLPALSFLLLVPTGILVYGQLHSFIRYAGALLIIWGFSGCILLLADYFKRKRSLYVRLLRFNKKRDPLKHSIYLKSTVCGLSILWALHARDKKNIRGVSL